MRPKGGNHLAPKARWVPNHNFDPQPHGHQNGHKSHRTQFWPWTTMDHISAPGLWQPPEAPRSAQPEIPSTYGECFPSLHAPRTQGCRSGAYMVLYTIMHHFFSAIQCLRFQDPISPFQIKMP
ncbi:hypothetical protein O181_102862 [Austropuccinia psidii MF-1]|uniref:Uncharacterized protein n=1 Tax=Austropuccinia psidii MF-1 TaxID=1389203 RepID=A0A9Q3JJZ9_9BASI|nr:hypothetical protein [Austropuccinia psidii MF-1]